MKITSKMVLNYAHKVINDFGAEEVTLIDTSGNEQIYDKSEILDKIATMVEALEKKAATPKKPTKAQIENEALAENVYTFILGHEGLSAAEIGEMLNMSAAKITSLCGRNLTSKVYANKEKRETSKGKVNCYYIKEDDRSMEGEVGV